MKELMIMINLDFNKYDDITDIINYDGFIDQNGYFYKVSLRTNKNVPIDHNLWADAYIKSHGDKFRKCNFTSSTLFTLSQISSPVDVLVHIYGFVYYSHGSEYHRPIIKIPNPMYNNCTMTRSQDELLYNIMLLNNEHPENNPIFVEDDVFEYGLGLGRRR